VHLNCNILNGIKDKGRAYQATAVLMRQIYNKKNFLSHFLLKNRQKCFNVTETSITARGSKEDFVLHEEKQKVTFLA
jgi:hypothetical protein